MSGLQTLPPEDAYQLLRDYGQHSSAFLSMNANTGRLRPPGTNGFIAYRQGGRRHLFELCGPIGADDDRERVLLGFLEEARRRRQRIAAVQLSLADAALHAQHGFVVNQLGASYSLDLVGYTLGGQRMVKVRNMVNRARREGVTVSEATPNEQASAELAGHLDQIDTDWLHAKGRHVKELDFLIGERGGPGAQHRRLFTACHQGRVIAYISYSPAFGERTGWLYDLTRRSPQAPPGTVDLLFATALETFQHEGSRWLHLGFTPFVQLAPRGEAPGPTSGVLHRCIELLGTRGRALYPAAAQESFKLKWRPQHIEPEYLAFQNGVSPAAVWSLMRLTRTV